jgi:hypothetical protein
MILLGMDLVMALRAKDHQMRERFMGNEIVAQVMNLAACIRPLAHFAADTTILPFDLTAFPVPRLGPARPPDVIGVSLGARFAADQLGPVEEEELAVAGHWRLLFLMVEERRNSAKIFR